MTQQFSDDPQDGPPSRLGRLLPVANRCTAGSCPTVYTAADPSSSRAGVVVVQGYAVSAQQAGIEVPDGEVLVEVPLELLAEAVRNLS